MRLILAYSECLDAFGETIKALDFLRCTALSWRNIPEIWIHGARLLYKHPELNEIANGWLNEAKSHHPSVKQFN
jgi:hypothetical protein